MKILPKTKFILAVFIFLLVLNFVDRRSPIPTDGLPTIPVMVKDEIQRIELSVASEKIILERQDDIWMMTAPSESKADWSRIRSMILNFRKEIKMDALIDTDDDEEYGLDAGNAIVVEIWTDKERPTASFLVGNDSAYGSSFVRISGSESIYRARIGGRRRYAYGATDWQNQRVLDFELENFKSLFVRSQENQAYTLIRDNGWKIDPPISGNIDERKIEQALKSLSVLRIGQRETTESVPYSEFQLILADDQKIDFQASKPKDGGTVITIPGVPEQYRVAAPAIERFLAGSEWFKDRRKVVLNPREQMDMIRFYSDSIEIVLQQDLSSGFWRVLQPSNIDLDMRQIFYMVNTLASLESIYDIEEPQKYQDFFGDPPIFIEIRTLTGGVQTIEISKKIELQNTRGYLFRLKQQNEIFLVAEKDLETILTAFGKSLSVIEN